MAEYLKGGVINTDEGRPSHLDEKKKGWVLMLADDYSIGWSKLVGDVLKNHYPKGLRK